MARLALGAVGAVAGFFIGGPVGALQGFAIAYGLGAGLDPNQKVLGPRLSDLKAPQANYGAVIPYIEGAPRVAGCFIWASDKREIATTTTTGKGGPGVDSTSFTYEIDVGLELAINRCQAVRRIWSNGKLVWSNADDADGETVAASAATNSWRDMRFYDGNPDQLPDPTYEALVGVGNAPAYRSRTTIVFEGLNLGGSGQLPVLTFEILSESNGSFDVVLYEPAAPAVAPFALGTPAYSVGAPFDVIVGGADTAAGLIHSFDVYSVDAVAGTSTLVNHFDIPDGNWGTMTGNSDESCIVVEQAGGSPVDFVVFYAADGSSVVLDTSDNGFPGKVFSKVGDDIVLAVTDGSGDRKLRRYARSNGALVATAAAGLVADVQSVAIGGSFVYSLATAGDKLFKSDLTTLALVDTIAIPADYNAASGHVACDGGTPYILGAGSVPWTFPLVKWDGGSWVPIAYASNGSFTPHDPDPTPDLADLYADPGNSERLGFGEGVLFSQKFDTDHVAIRYLVGKTAISLPTLAEVVTRLNLRTKQLELADFDVTDLESDYVRSMAITQVTSTRATLESLMAAYLFEWAEADTLRAVKRGGASVVTIPFADLGVSEQGDAEPLPKKRANDMEQVARVSVRYANVTNDSQDGLERADRLTTESQAEALVEVPVGFTPEEAKRLADANTMDLAVKILQLGPISLSRKYSFLEVADPFIVTAADGSTFRVRAQSGKVGRGVNVFDLILDDASAINSSALTDDDYFSSTLIRLLSESILEVLDIPILRDEDNALGPYVAVGAGAKWSSSQIDKSDDGTTFVNVATIAARSTIGTATTTLGDWAGGVGTFDEVNVVRVDVGADGVLSSASKADAILGNAPPYLIGSELLYACDATFVSPGIYDLSTFLRGERGTEWAIAAHGSDELVVLLEAAGLRKVTDDGSDLNTVRYYRATTVGKAPEPTGDPFTDTGVAMKPFAPVDLIVNHTGGAFEITWHRRSRLASLLFGGEPPLGEVTESYDVELRDASDVLVDSQTVSEPAYDVTSLFAGDAIGAPIWGMKTITGTRVAVRDDAQADFSVQYLVALDADGAVEDSTPATTQRIVQWDNDGTNLVLLTHEAAATVPPSYGATKVYRYALGSLSSGPAATYTDTLADGQGLAFDGTDFWVAEQSSNLLRRLDKTTLASIATYATAGGPSGLFYLSGKLYVCCLVSGEIVRFDTTSHTEDWRVSMAGLGSAPFDVYVNADVAVFYGVDGVLVVDPATGATLQSFTNLFPFQALPQRSITELGGVIVVAIGSVVPPPPGPRVLLLDAVTGAEIALVTFSETYLPFVAGNDGTDLYLTAGDGVGAALTTRKYQIAPADLAGFTFTVWQKSAVVGRGYPATLEL